MGCSLPKTVTRQRRDCDLNLGPSSPESSTLTTRLPTTPLLIERLQLSVCLFTSSGTAYLSFIKFSTPVTRETVGFGPPVLRRRCDTLCTGISGFVDDVMLPVIGQARATQEGVYFKAARQGSAWT